MKRLPNITIYVKSADVPLFQRAKEDTSSMSLVIATALREYYERRDGTEKLIPLSLILGLLESAE